MNLWIAFQNVALELEAAAAATAALPGSFSHKSNHRPFPRHVGTGSPF